MNARQAAEYRDSIARMKLAAEKQRRAELAHGRIAEPVPSLPPTTEAEAELATRLQARGGICADSAIDPNEQAVCVARMILAARPVPSPPAGG